MSGSITHLDRVKIRQDNTNHVKHLSYEELSGRDSSLKKIPVFIRKLKTLGQVSGDISAEFEKLRLTKYVSEAVVSLMENKFKSSGEILKFLEVSSLFYRTYGSFAEELETCLYDQITFVDDSSLAEDKFAEHLSRQKVLLRLAAELNLIGIFKDPLRLLEAVKMFLTVEDKVSHRYLPIAMYFVKNMKKYYLDAESEFQPLAVTLKFSEVFNAYYKSLCRLLTKAYSKIETLEHRGKFHYETRGDLSEKQTSTYLESKAFFEGLNEGLKVYAELMGAEMPQFKKLSVDVKVVDGKIVFTDYSAKIETVTENTIFGSEEDRAFYEDLISLKDLVPSDLLPEMSTEVQDDTVETVDIKEEIDPDEVNGQTEGLSSLQELIASLEKVYNSAMVDKISVDFCFNAPKSLIKNLPDALIGLCRGRVDLISFVGRFLANIKPYYPGLVNEINNSLVGQFWFLSGRTEPIRGTRSRVCKFIGELTKFRVMPQGKAFACLKRSVEIFTHYNIDMVSMLLEACGRFLYYQPESHNRIENVVEIILRKKRLGLADSNRVVMLENALFLLQNTGANKMRPRKEKSNQRKYLEHLMFVKLSLSNAEEVFKSIRRLPWKDEVFLEEARRSLKKVWKIKDGCHANFSAILSGLSKYYPGFTVALIDDLLEDVYVGMETGLHSWSHRRIAVVRMLGEFYNYSLVDADVVIGILNLLLSHGHAFGIARFTSPSPIDPSTDFFRIRLVCILLQVVGQYFKEGPLAAFLKHYLVAFKYYISTKAALPLEINNLLQDTFEALGSAFYPDDPRVCIDDLIEQFGSQFTFLHADQEAYTSGSPTEEQDVEEYDDSYVDEEADEEFDKILSDCIDQSLEARKLERKSMPFDASIPIQTKKTSSDPGKLAFKLLLKKKNKSVTQDLELTVSSTVLNSYSSRKKDERSEIQAVIQKTLEYEEHQTTDQSGDEKYLFLEAIKQIAPPKRTDFRKPPTRKRYYRFINKRI